MTRLRTHLPGLAAALLVASLLTPARAADTAGDALRYSAGHGLQPGANDWPRWQGRLGLATDASVGGGLETAPAAGSGLAYGLSLLGDYYFLTHDGADRRLGGGFRATGGLILGDRSAAWMPLAGGLAGQGYGFSSARRGLGLWNPADDGDGRSATYFGVGYTGLGAASAAGGGWGFSADLGVMALRPRSAVRLGQQSLADTLRALDLAPTLQLGVSYSF